MSDVLHAKPAIAQAVIPMKFVHSRAAPSAVMMKYSHVRHVFDRNAKQECADQVVSILRRTERSTSSEPFIERAYTVCDFARHGHIAPQHEAARMDIAREQRTQRGALDGERQVLGVAKFNASAADGALFAVGIVPPQIAKIVRVDFTIVVNEH